MGSSHVIRSSVFACLLHSWLGTTLANLFQHICHLIYHFHRHYAIVFFSFLRIVAFFDGLLYQIAEWVTWQTACLFIIVPCFTKNCCPLQLSFSKEMSWLKDEQCIYSSRINSWTRWRWYTFIASSGIICTALNLGLYRDKLPRFKTRLLYHIFIYTACIFYTFISICWSIVCNE